MGTEEVGGGGGDEVEGGREGGWVVGLGEGVISSSVDKRASVACGGHRATYYTHK